MDQKDEKGMKKGLHLKDELAIRGNNQHFFSVKAMLTTYWDKEINNKAMEHR